MGKVSRLGNSLYTGERSIDFVGRKWLWYAISGLIVALAVLGLGVKGLNYGIEFTGGTQYKVTIDSGATQKDADDVREAVGNLGIQNADAPVVSTSGNNSVLIQTEELTDEESTEVNQAIIDTLGVTQQDISQDQIGASWGDEVKNRAILGLVVFLVLVMLFIWAYFREWKMSVAGIVALAHDVIITVGVYALSGFEVTPATVTGLLTILGFSLYDTVVVFDKIRENTKNLRSSRTTYARAANLAVNQTLVRSINTSVVALIPVGAILYVSAVQLGASSLKDLALALFVGMAAGAYSSIFIATPLLVHLKSGESEVLLAERRQKARDKRTVDPYAAVPVFTDDMAVEDDPDARRERGGVLVDDDDYDEDDRATRPSADPEAMGRGRTVPTSQRPVGRSSSSGRQQPTRAPKSKRK
ncbi:protein translocase subunit SecF [Nocardioides anomalus]|uniref:Protein-export membrane protein SecF n=1 Tax=Nocardioides anomalus TaxID=2712223 RepID=A0A6G6WEE1_9ACTN|nr:protein translocase subunit SecF [Nocardioides anomalus]QIG43523.1 protein translocase subunit SecF [Nocardioides anomalus]